MVEEQGTKTEDEGTEESTNLKKEPTAKVYKTDDEVQKAVSTGVSKGLESIQRQLDIQRAELEKVTSDNRVLQTERDTRNIDLQDAKAENERLMQKVDDPDVRNSIMSERAIAEAKKANALETAKTKGMLLDIKNRETAVRVASKATEVMRETGISLKELENCKTEEDVVITGLKYQLAHLKVEPEDEEGEDGKSNFAAPSGGGEGGKDLDNLTTKELYRKAYSQKR